MAGSPVGLVGALAVGGMFGAFFAMTPRFAQEALEATPTGVALLMSAVVVGGVLGQYPLGRWSDRIDRRLVIASAGLGVVAAALALIARARVAARGLRHRAAAGMVLMPLYPLVIAHANDYAEPDEFVSVAGGLLMLYGIGAILGPTRGRGADEPVRRAAADGLRGGGGGGARRLRGDPDADAPVRPGKRTRRLCLSCRAPRPWCSRWIHGERRRSFDLFDDWLAGLDAAAAETASDEPPAAPAAGGADGNGTAAPHRSSPQRL